MTKREGPLLHICYAPADHGWVHGRMLPALGLSIERCRTRADDHLGEPQLVEIARAVEDCRFTILVASSATRWDRLTQFAADLAQHATVEQQTPRFFIIARDAPPGSEAERAQRPLSQRALVSLDCTDEPRTIESLTRLRQLLALQEPTDLPPTCPYPGLERFTAANRHLLFGRDRDREAVLQRIHACHTRLLMLGPSGSGKSSLIHAAVLPTLRPDRYLVRIVPRGEDLAVALRATIDMLEVPDAGVTFDRYLAESQHASDADLENARLRLRAALSPDVRRRIVVVDPLEEIFATDDMTARETLFQLLGGLWSLPWCTVILCMRADFYGALMSERYWRELEHSQYTIAPLDEAGLRAAIMEPARHAGVHIEATLVERLIREIDRDRSSAPLPLLQVALKDLWERITWRCLTLESYIRNTSDDQRGLAAALAVHADGVLQSLTAPGDRELAQRILLDLVHLGEGRPHTRQRRSLRELRRNGDPPGQLARVLDALIEGRLIMTSDGDRAVTPWAVRYIDLAHDVLISGWSSLATWVKDRQGDLVTHRRLEVWARKWVEADHQSGFLDEGDTAEARAWRDSPAGKALGVSESLVELIDASEAAHARARREKEEMIARLLDEQRKTRESVAAAVQVADEIVFQVDNNLRTLTGASRVREVLLARSRALLGDLRALGGLDTSVQRTEMVTKSAQAAFARERGRLGEAYRLLGEVHAHAQRQADADPANTEWQRDLAMSFHKLGEVALAAGKPDDARAWFEQGLVISKALVDTRPVHTGWQRDLARSFTKLGDAALAAGKFDDARAWFEQSLAIRKTLTGADPTHAGRQRDLSVALEKLGDVAMVAGSLDDARAWFEQSLAIRKTLAVADPADPRRQRDLSVAFGKLGDVATDAGELYDACVWLVRSLTVCRALVNSDSTNAQWQRDLSVTYTRLGAVAATAGKLDHARTAFDLSLGINETLAKADPSNLSWQRALAMSYNKLGDMTAITGRLHDASTWFQQGLAVHKTLAIADPANAQSQRDLATSYNKLGEMAVVSGRLNDARRWFEQSLAVHKTLAFADPTNAQWQRDLATSYSRLGNVAVVDGPFDGAHMWSQRSFAASKTLGEPALTSDRWPCDLLISDDIHTRFETLTGTNPANVGWQRHLAVSYDKLGDLAVAACQFEDARAWFEQGLAIHKTLINIDPANLDWQRQLAMSYNKLGNVAAAVGKFEEARAWFERSLAVDNTVSDAETTTSWAAAAAYETYEVTNTFADDDTTCTMPSGLAGWPRGHGAQLAG